MRLLQMQRTLASFPPARVRYAVSEGHEMVIAAAEDRIETALASLEGVALRLTSGSELTSLLCRTRQLEHAVAHMREVICERHDAVEGFNDKGAA